MATYVSLKLNKEEINKRMHEATARSQKIKDLAYEKAEVFYSNARKEMIDEFEEHNITKDLDAGTSNPANEDSVGSLLGGMDGNLFSFLGFNAGSKPVEGLRALIYNGTSLKQTIYKNKAWHFRVYYPSKSQIEAATPMTWELGNSWAYAVEHNISNLSNYIHKHWAGPNSKSKEGLQVKHKYTNYDYVPRPYISEILKNFKQKVGAD